MGGPQSGGGSALMPKGEKPKGPDLLPVADVARQLRVDSKHVENWMQKGQLRGGASGIRPYDFKKFQLDYAEEIRVAQKQAVAEKQTKSDRKPKKGFFSKFSSIFGGGGKEDQGGDSKKLAQENKKLKEELRKLKKAKSSAKSGDEDRDLEEKIRYLEKQAGESRALEVEVAKLKRQLKEQPGGEGGQAEEQLRQELEQARKQLLEAQQLADEGHQLREALATAQQQREKLETVIDELQSNTPPAPDPSDSAPEAQELKMALAQKEQAFAQLQAHAQQMAQENARLKESQVQVQEPASSPEAPLGDTRLTDELLDLQRRNLGRFQKLKSLYQETLLKLQDKNQSEDVKSDQSQELAELQEKYERLSAQQSTDNPAHQEVVEQLSQARVTVTKIKEENKRLQEQLADNDQEASRITELEQKLRDAQSNTGSNKLLEAELESLRKGMQVKENQVQKVASRLADNEKRLAKAMQESARLTELLIERENRLRELSTEFEQEYRDKMENLDRQVSGLQWKLSLREERIAHLESELLGKSE